MDQLNDLFVLVSVKQLETLLDASKEIPSLKHELSRCYEQLEACRFIQTEILDKYKELYDML